MNPAEPVLEWEADDGQYVHQRWTIGAVLSAYFIYSLARPCVFVNYRDYDIFHALLGLGFADEVEDAGLLSVQTPHGGGGHNCFKMPKADVMLFLLTLDGFCERHRAQLDELIGTDLRLKDWQTSWWYEPTGSAR
jgi:hypothetical protein